MPDNPYAAGLMSPNMRQNGLWDLRMMSSANRMETPFEHGGHGYMHPMAEGGMLGNLAGMANEPDYSSFTYNPQARAAATTALAPYGQAPLAPEAVKQNTMLPNSGFFGVHPRLSAAIEGAIYGGAAAHGGNTPGESIQGALSGLIGGQRIRQGIQRQQFARPFEAAGMMEQLQDAQQRRALQEEDIQHMRAVDERLKYPPEKSITPLGRNVAGYMEYDPKTGNQALKSNPYFDPTEAGSERESASLDIGTREQLRIMGVGIGHATPQQIKIANGKAQQQAIARNVGAHVGDKAADVAYNNYNEASKDHSRKVDEMNRQILKLDDPSHQEWAKQEIFNERMAEMAQNPDKKYAPDYLFSIGPNDIQAKISGYNQSIQSQIDQENQSFTKQWPQSLEAPPTKGKAGKSAPKTPHYDQKTGRLVP